MQFEDRDGVDLNSGCNFWTESFDAYGDAVVLLDIDLSQVVDHDFVDLNSGGNSRRELFDVHGGAGCCF